MALIVNMEKKGVICTYEKVNFNIQAMFKSLLYVDKEARDIDKKNVIDELVYNLTDEQKTEVENLVKTYLYGVIKNLDNTKTDLI